MSAFLDETGTLITVDHSNPLPVALVAGFTSLNDGELKTASYANPLPVTVVTTNYTDAELPTADSVAVGTEVYNTTYKVKMRSNGTSWEWLGIGTAAFSTFPLANSVPSNTVFNATDIGEGGSLWRSNGTKWLKMGLIHYYEYMTPVVITGTTLETTLNSFIVKGGVMGASGKMRVYIIGSTNNNANNKIFRLKHGATTLYQLSVTNSLAFVSHILVMNTSTDAQLTALYNTSGISGGSGSSSTISSAINTNNDFTLTVTGQLSNAADSLTVQGILVEIF